MRTAGTVRPWFTPDGGKTGDQLLEGQNRDVAENRKRLFVLEAAGPRQLRYLGAAKCTQFWIARSIDSKGVERNVYKFRLSFDDAIVKPSTVPIATRTPPSRRSRSFLNNGPPASRTVTQTRVSTPEETSALQEKANQEHYRVLVALAGALTAAGWTGLEEIPSAVDLWAKTPDGKRRVIFEVKTLAPANEVSQCRAALSQLLEYWA